MIPEAVVRRDVRLQNLPTAGLQNLSTGVRSSA